jgi:hypothetical protein
LGNHEYSIKPGSESVAAFPGGAGVFWSEFDPVVGVEFAGLIPTSLRVAYDPTAYELDDTLTRLLLRTSPAVLSAGYFRRLRESPVWTLVQEFFDQPEVTDRLGSGGVQTWEDMLRRSSSSQRRQAAALVPEFLARRVARRPSPQRQFGRRVLSPYLANGAQVLGADLGRVRHLGPLRQPPQAIYRSVSLDADDVGDQGEFTAAVLNRFADRPVPFAWAGQVLTEPLGDAVDRWMTFLGVHAGARAREVGRFGHVLGIHDEALNKDLDLTQVGVGVSQVLPVVVQTLLTPIGGLLLLEQPELHLHPAVQARLVAFLSASAAPGRQVLCETHSEYVVNAVRILAGERGRQTAESERIFFVTREGANSQLEEVRLDAGGRIRNWPKGFFDQSTLDAARLIELDLRAQ